MLYGMKKGHLTLLNRMYDCIDTEVLAEIFAIDSICVITILLSPGVQGYVRDSFSFERLDHRSAKHTSTVSCSSYEKEFSSSAVNVS